MTDTPRPTPAYFYGAPLTVDVSDGAVVIRIGIGTLAHAVTYAPWATRYDEQSGDHVRDFAIVDATQFAADVIREMLREAEDGATLLSNFIDKASEAAMNDGSTGLHEDFNHRIKHGDKSPLETW